MLSLKFRRVGKKNQASFRVIAIQKRLKIDGRFTEDVGWYNPHTDQAKLNKDRIEYWLQKGIQPTDSVRNLLVKQGIVKGPKRPVHSRKKKKEEID